MIDRKAVRSLGLAVALAFCLSACAGAREADPGPTPTETRPSAPAASAPQTDTVAPVEAAESQPTEAVQHCSPGHEKRLGGRQVAYAAALVRRVAVLRRPGGARVDVFKTVNRNGFPTVFGVRGVVLDGDCEPVWYHVQLPVRPNGSTGYVRARAVDLYRVTTRVEIDLSERRIEVFDGGRRVLRTVAAIGATHTPTPTGRYYVNQRLRPADPTGPWGPAALGISAFSPTLLEWTQGGPIAIHGTNEPDSIGGETSNGCLRVGNRVMKALFKRVLAGSPVLIRA